jgi:hypothetical protein
MTGAIDDLAGRIALVAGAVCVGAFFGYRYADNACEAQQGKAQAEVVVQHNDAADSGQAVEKKSVQRAAKTEAVFNGIQKGVTTYAQNHPVDDCRLDADGLRLWRAANANTDALPSGERSAALSSAADAAERGDDGPSRQPYRGDEGISPVQGSASGVGGMAGENAR